MRIAVISPNENVWSETFIQAHREQLFPKSIYLYGAWLPRFTAEGKHLLSESSLVQGVVYHTEKLLGKREHHRLRRAIAAHLRETGCQAVLAEYGPTGVEMMGICAELGVPLIVHFHGFDVYDGDLLAEYGDRYPELFEAAAAIVAVSRDMEKRLIEAGAPAEMVVWNPCGPDTHLFTPGDPGKNPPRFLAAGRFSSTKGAWLTLEAFALACAEVPEMSLVMIGEGLHLDRCKALAGQLGIKDRVEFQGVRPHAEVATEMQKARAFVQHSRVTETGDSEGTPVAIQEAGAAGLPVISTLHAGIPDVVIQGETGILVPEGAVAEMAQAMVKLAQEPELASQMGATAAQHIRANFSLDRHLKTLRNLILRAVQDFPTSQG